jgi:DNA processing protein
MNDSSLAWIALNRISGVGPALCQRLLQDCGSAAAVFSAGTDLLVECQGVSRDLAERITAYPWKQAAEKEWEACRKQGCGILTLEEEDYPETLRSLACPPPVLYFRGALVPDDRRALAVVGSRRPSAYGLTAAGKLSGEMARAGFTIVSGLARGIDAAAHEAALAAGGRTLAVLAHGLDQLYPREHRKLHDRLVEQGAALSEFPLGFAAVPGNFPRRNRIISGLALGVLVVEAGTTSGSLITARWATEQGREVFAIPGNFNSPLSVGTHALIQDGAKLVTRLEDILEELQAAQPLLPETKPKPKPPVLTPVQEKIMKALESGRLQVDQLALACGQPIPGLLAELLILELKGLVVNSPGQMYEKGKGEI